MKNKYEKTKRELVRKKQLELLARGVSVYQHQLEDDYMPNDEVILEQIVSLKRLRDKYPRLSRGINEDLSVLFTNHNYTTIKNFNEQNIIIRNDVERMMIDYLYLDYVLNNCELSQKQKQMVYDYYTGRVYSDKNLKNAFGKIKDYVERDGMAKELMNEDTLKKIFPLWFSKSEDYYDCYLDISRKLSCYNESVAESKRKGDRIRALSLATAILPLSLDLDDEVKEND